MTSYSYKHSNHAQVTFFPLLTMASMKPLLLAGGLSSRMGRRKELLRLPNGTPMYIHLISLLHETLQLPKSDPVYLSLRDPSALQDLLQAGRATKLSEEHIMIESSSSTGPLPVQVLYDEDLPVHHEYGDIGPASGLLRAHQYEPTWSWLVVACDYPILTAAAINQLRQSSSGAVTCFQNKDGYHEPLLGSWTPVALDALHENVRQGITGPSAVVRQLNSISIRPELDEWLANANTQEEWTDIMTKINGR